MKYLLTIILIIFCLINVPAQNKNIIGKWKTIDDETKLPKSVVEIYKKDNGKYYGKIIKLFPKEGNDPDPIVKDGDKKDPRFGRKIIGLEIVKDLEKDDDEYSGGTIYDPKKGKEYKCKMWIEKGKLMVRGYVLFFHRTQEWEAYEE